MCTDAACEYRCDLRMRHAPCVLSDPIMFRSKFHCDAIWEHYIIPTLNSITLFFCNQPL